MSKVPLQPYKRPEAPPEPSADFVRATMTAPPEPEPPAEPLKEPQRTKKLAAGRSTTVTSIRVDAEDWKEFRMIAIAEGTDASALVREAMRRFLAAHRRRK